MSVLIKFLGGGGKKQPESVPKLGRGMVPTDKVKGLSDKGFSEPEIIDILRKEGYSSEEIDSALTQALKLSVTGQPGSTVERPPTLRELQMQSNELNPPIQSMPILDEYNQPPQIPEPSMQFQQQAYYPQGGYDTEELIESIVQERMGELDQKLTEFRSKYASLERKMMDLHNQLTIISKNKSESENLILNKIDSFGTNINEMNARLSSLEKAFKEALPALIESVRSLTDLVSRLKRET